MAPLTAEELAAVCREADPATVAGFVAALQAARGRAVERGDGPALLLDGERVVVPDGSPPEDADVVVTAGRPVDPGGARALDAEELRGALLYAVDRETADDLLRAHFDRPLASFEGAPGTVSPTGREDDDGSATEGTAVAADAATAPDPAGPGTPGGAGDGEPDHAPNRRRSRRALAGTLAVAVVLAVVAVGWPGGPLAGGGDEPALSGVDVRPVGPGPYGSWDLDGDGTAADDADGGGAGGGFPPGVGESGEVDEERLVAANAAILRNHSYRVTLTYREFVDGTETAVFTQTARVGNGSHVRVTTARFGTFEDAPPRLLYGDGGVEVNRRVERDEVGTREAVRAGDDPVLERLSTYLGYYLSVRSSRIADARTVDGTRTVRIVTDGDPWTGVENATGSAVVTGDGLVRMVRRSYDDPNSPARVVVTVRVSDVGRTNVSAAGAGG